MWGEGETAEEDGVLEVKGSEGEEILVACEEWEEEVTVVVDGKC